MNSSKPKPHHEAQLHYGGLDLHLVVFVDPKPELETSYRVTCFNNETGRIIGSTLLPAGRDGGPPGVTVGDVIGLIGGGYRLASIFVEIESERLAKRTRRVRDGLRRRDRSWLRHAKRSVPYGSPLERSFLRELA